MIDRYTIPSQLSSAPGRMFHVMAKPGGSTCNLDCKYCFYLSKETLPNGPGTGRMSDETLELFIRQYIEGVTGPEVVFSWQGGEPTLRGLDFFRRVVALQKKYAKPGQGIENDLQTNGVLIDERWADFLKEHHFLVGLSIDGPRELHDQYRVTKGGEPTFEKVMAAAKLLRQIRGPVQHAHLRQSLQRVATARRLPFSAQRGRFHLHPVHPDRAGEGVRENRAATREQDALPIVGSPRARPDHPNSSVTDWSVDAEECGYFLCSVFDEWRRKDLGKVLVNHFETLVSQHMGLSSQVCIYNEFCGKGVAVEHDGGVYSCDHYVYPEYRLGTLREKPLAEMVFSPIQVKFGYAKSETLPRYCRDCSYLTDCWGECPKNRLIRTPDGEAGLNYLCAGLKKFFEHAIPEVERIASDIRRLDRDAPHTAPAMRL